MKRWTSLVLFLIAFVLMAGIAQARPRVENDLVTFDRGSTLNFLEGSMFKILGVEVTASAEEINTLDGLTATTEELNAAADVGSRVVNVSPTNGAVLTLSADTPVVILTPIGGANDTTNTLTIATPFPVGVEF
jgi:hypothetical protein